MAFDMATARPVSGDEPEFDPATSAPAGGGFDMATAQPVTEDQSGESLPQQALDVLGELAASANRSVTEFLDFIGPDTANAILRLSGSDVQVPTLTGALEKTGIQGGFMQPGIARDAVRAGGQLISAAGAMAPVGRNAAKAGSAVADFLGIGASKTPLPVDGIVRGQPFTPASRSKKLAQELALKRGQANPAVAGVKLNEAGQVVADQAGKRATWQGFDDGFVAMVKSSSPETRQKMSAMLDVVEQGKKDFRYAAENRPLDIAGESVLKRIRIVREANRMARNRLDHVAKDLKGQRVDVQPAVESFLSELDDMGVKFSPKDGGLSFQGSDIEGVEGPQKVIRSVLNRMLNTRAPDAYDVHRLKRYIDEMVTYGKSAPGSEGLKGRSLAMVKALRHDLDGILDQRFPEYNRVNTEYAETIGALNAVQDVAGKKMDLLGENADKALGTLTRRLLSNAQSRIPLMDAANQLDEVAGRYVGQNRNAIVPYGQIVKRTGVESLDDDLLTQVMFTDQMDKMFGAASKTSLLGDAEKAFRAGTGGGKSMVVEGAVAAGKKMAGINEDNAIKAMRELLKEAN